MKEYIAPQSKYIFLDLSENVLNNLSGGLDGTSNGGGTGENGITGSESNRRAIWGDED